ncbi:hypothetical protein ES703_47057 [subsurface metagenome]
MPKLDAPSPTPRRRLSDLKAAASFSAFSYMGLTFFRQPSRAHSSMTWPLEVVSPGLMILSCLKASGSMPTLAASRSMADSNA